MDDILVGIIPIWARSGRAQQEIRSRPRIQSAGVNLNPEKCEFSKDQLKFLGHVIDKDGIAKS